MTQNDYYLAHAVDGQLTPEQMAEMLNLPEGDIEGEASNGGTPNAASVTGVADDDASKNVKQEPAPGAAAGAAATGADADPENLDPANAVILAKDGKHTISYDKLVAAREGEKHWKAQAEAAQRALAELQAAAQARADAGVAPTQTDNAVAAATAAIEAGANPDLFGDYSEEALAKGVRTLALQEVQKLVAPLLEQQKAAAQATAQTAEQQHYAAIYAAHPDADSIAESKELADWIERQPSFAREGYRSVLANGSTQQIVEFFDTFKQATGMTQAATTAPKVDPVAAAKAAIAAVKPGVPSSLSDFPGGAGAAADEMAAIRDLSGADLMAKLEGKSPEQIEALISRLV